MTPLHEQLRNAADDCTPSPLKDLLNRAADAVEERDIPSWQRGCIWAVTKGDRTICESPKSIHPAPIPDGMMLVPVEPTDAMINAGIEFAMHVKLYTWPDYIRDMYKAMLKAAGESS